MTQKTLIIGNGRCACETIEALLAGGSEIIVASKEMPPFSFPLTDLQARQIEMLTGAKTFSCRGAAGNFDIIFVKDGEKIYRSVQNIIIAEDATRKANFSLYGLKPGSHVISLSAMMKSISYQTDKSLNFSETKKAVFLTGLREESHPVILEEIMQACFRLQSEFQIRTYMLTKNLKVAGKGLESLYKKTRAAGMTYIKFTETMPEIRQESNGKVVIEFLDEISGERFRLMPDLTVADETILPCEETANLSEIFRLDRDREGFLQSDNVHRISVFTNRKGILAADGSRGIQSPAEQLTDAANAAVYSFGPAADLSENLEDRAVIQRDKCVRCLTCYRVCPYRAIILNARPYVVPEACERCGICAAECPRGAIEIRHLNNADISEQIVKAENAAPGGDKFIPFLVAFSCRRSAAQAAELASQMRHPLPKGLHIIEVPCAGSISHSHLFSALNHADGVLLLTCHEGNCHSESGNLRAQKRAAQRTEILSMTGFEKERILVKTLASNMGKEFVETTSQFEEKIMALGPSKLRN